MSNPPGDHVAFSLQLSLLPAASLALALALPACKTRLRPNFGAVVSLGAAAGTALPSEDTLAAELRARLAVLPIEAEVDPGPAGDKRLTIRLRATDKESALVALDTLCHSGDLRVRAVHDQTVYLSAAATRDPSKIPLDHQILNYTIRAAGQTRAEDLVVATTDILTGADVKAAEPENSQAGAVHISLTPSGGQKLLAATKSMQKGRSRLAIIYDGLIISAPVVSATLSSEFTLEGFNSFEEAQSVAAVLHKPLSTNLLIESLKPLAP